MGILDRLKKDRQYDDDEDSQEVDGDSDDETSPRGGLRGRFDSLRGIGGSAAGMLGKVLKRGGGEDDGEEDETSGRVAAGSAPAGSTGSPGESVADFLSEVDVGSPGEDQPEEDQSDEDELQPLAGITPPAGTGSGTARVSAKSDIFAVMIAVDPSLKDLAMSQDAISAQELAGDLEAFLYQLSRKFPIK